MFWKAILIIAMFDLGVTKGDFKDHEWERHAGTGSLSIVYKSYQTSIHCHASSPIRYPETIQEVQELVKTAIKNEQKVKAIGSLHSMTDIICTDGIPISLQKLKTGFIIQTDKETGKETVVTSAGAELNDLLMFLHQRNRTLIHMPHSGGLTIAGTMGTGAHGSSLKYPPSLSDQMVGVTIVDGNGDLRVIDNSDEIKAFRVHLGLLGVIVEVTLQIVPLFKMTTRNYVESESILLNGKVLELAENQDFIELVWSPFTKKVVVMQGTYLNDDPSTIPGEDVLNLYYDKTEEEILGAIKLIEELHATRNTSALQGLEELIQTSLYTNIPGMPPFYTEPGDRNTLRNPATGFGWQLLSNRCTKCAWDVENFNFEDASLVVDLQEMPKVIQSIRDILGQSEASFPLIGIFLRFYRPSEALMSVTRGRPSVVFEVPTNMRQDPFSTARHGLAAYQAISQTMLKVHGARPHWGKNGLHYFNKDVINSLGNKREAFIQVMKKYDPKGTFMNKFGLRLLGHSDEMEINPNVKHCALQEYCICSKDLDCAEGQTCSDINGHPVCKDGDVKELKSPSHSEEL